MGIFDVCDRSPGDGIVNSVSAVSFVVILII